MTVEEELEELGDIPDVPRAAYADLARHEISNDWLRTASVAEQAAAIADWFLARFQDPAHETPYMTSEGGYLWTRGGPYDAAEQIGDRFAGLVDDRVIEWAVEYVQDSESVWDWAPTQLTYYDEEQDLFIEDKDVPLQQLEERLDGLLAVLTLQGHAAAVEMARSLAYAGVISALETFLWETMAYWVDHDELTVRSLIKDHSAFKDRKVLLGSIFEVYESMGVQVKTHMQRMTWHRWDEARSLIEHGLGITTPSFDPFEAPTQKRHDVIHRSGHDVDGNPVSITIEEVRDLAAEVQRFANQMHRLIDRAKMPPEERFEGDF